MEGLANVSRWRYVLPLSARILERRLTNEHADFNTQPREITYRLLMGLPLTPAQEGDLDRSTVVHQSVDKLHDPSFVPPPESEATKQADADGIRDGNLSQHPDKVIRNARQGGEGDGMVGLEEIKRLFGGGKEVRSAYGEGYGRVEGEQEQWYVERLPEVQSGSGWVIEESEEVKEKRRGGSWEERVRRGDFEPRFTNCASSGSIGDERAVLTV